jgi:hypothetical protein
MSRSSIKVTSIKNLPLKWAWVMALLLFAFTSQGQSLHHDPVAFPVTPKGYIAPFADKAPLIDGSLSDAVWEQAPWSDYFVDIEGSRKPLPPLKTRVKMLWNDSCLFVAAAIEEPHVWASLTQHDAIVYHDNDFEVFIDPDNDTHKYFEIEVNAFNTIFDLFLPRPYRNGGSALIPYDVAALRSAVRVQGTLNDPSDKDSSWTVEMAIPFRSVSFGNIWRAPAEGTIWRINFSRVQWESEVVKGKYSKKKNNQGRFLPEHNWVWSPQGVINMHFPERWGYLQFTRNTKNDQTFTLPYQEKQKQVLWLVYYKQKEYFSKHGRYSSSLSDLGWNKNVNGIDGITNELKMESTSRQFTVYIQDKSYKWSINDEGRVQPVKQMP